MRRTWCHLVYVLLLKMYTTTAHTAVAPPGSGPVPWSPVAVHRGAPARRSGGAVRGGGETGTAWRVVVASDAKLQCCNAVGSAARGPALYTVGRVHQRKDLCGSGSCALGYDTCCWHFFPRLCPVQYGDKERALWHYCALLDCAHRPPAQQATHVQQFLNLLAGVREQAAVVQVCSVHAHVHVANGARRETTRPAPPTIVPPPGVCPARCCRCSSRACACVMFVSTWLHCCSLPAPQDGVSLVNGPSLPLLLPLPARCVSSTEGRKPQHPRPRTRPPGRRVSG